MKRALLVATLFAGTLAGCGSPAITDYTTSRDSLFYLKQIKPTKVSVGEFRGPDNFDKDGGRLLWGCDLPSTDEEALDNAPLLYLREAFVEELTASGSFSAIPVEPELSGIVTQMSLDRDLVFDGTWSIELLLKSSNGAELLVREEYGFDIGAFFGPTLCQEAVRNFEPAVRSLLEKAIQSPDFPALVKAS